MKPTWPATPHLPVAWGEVFDKLTILEIKQLYLTGPQQQESLMRERSAIDVVVGERQRFPRELQALIDALHELNLALWDIEEGKRACEREQRFDAEFIQLARDVYLKNDQRAVIKRRINDLLGSDIREEKSHRTVT